MFLRYGLPMVWKRLSVATSEPNYWVFISTLMVVGDRFFWLEVDGTDLLCCFLAGEAFFRSGGGLCMSFFEEGLEA